MELDFSQMALEVSHHNTCWSLIWPHKNTAVIHLSTHAYWYMNVMRSSRLFRVSLFVENGSILMIWGCFSFVYNVIRSNYCCRRHTMHGNMVFSRDSIFPTPQQSGCSLACSVDDLRTIFLVFLLLYYLPVFCPSDGRQIWYNSQIIELLILKLITINNYSW